MCVALSDPSVHCPMASKSHCARRAPNAVADLRHAGDRTVHVEQEQRILRRTEAYRARHHDADQFVRNLFGERRAPVAVQPMLGVVFVQHGLARAIRHRRHQVRDRLSRTAGPGRAPVRPLRCRRYSPTALPPSARRRVRSPARRKPRPRPARSRRNRGKSATSRWRASNGCSTMPPSTCADRMQAVFAAT